MTQMTHFEAVTFLRQAPSVVTIVVQRDKGDSSSPLSSQSSNSPKARQILQLWIIKGIVVNVVF